MRLEVGRRVRAQAPFLFVLAIMITSVIYLSAAPGHWRRGVGIISVGMLAAGALRLVLPRRYAGLLAVRARLLDVVCYVALGVAILLLSIRLRG
jgi:Protein of unknown function (DUF3017)